MIGIFVPTNSNFSLSWPQVVDELLEDMYLRSHRSGGSWYNWIFKVIDLKEIATLGEERQAIRAETSLV